ncbi:MAG: hypothetical protein M3O85_02030 [Acidobacteriota bacterium]|nr:hypothetical protein [Acidobacteriota bacterium]
MRLLRPLTLISLCVLLACSRHSVKDLPAQTYQGFEIKVLSIESKGSDWTDSNNQRFRARLVGGEIVAVEVSFRALSKDGGDLLSIDRLELEDNAGNRYPSLLTEIRLVREAHLSKSIPWQLPFEAPKGAELKTLRVNDLTFALR